MTPQPVTPLFSIITPTAGKRPKALAQAVGGVAAALIEHPVPLEMLIGLDGCSEAGALAALPEVPPFVRVIAFPGWGGFGNRVRNALMRVARGEHLLFLDDDNAYLPGALGVFSRDLDADMAVARIDVSRAFDKPVLPEEIPGESVIRQCNVDPLCLRVRRELALTRCGGWDDAGGYESDFLNIARYHRRARKTAMLRELVGVYDAGRGLDPQGANPRQRRTAR